MKPKTELFRRNARESLNNLAQRQLAQQIAGLFRMLRQFAMQSYPDPKKALGEVAEIRRRSLEELPELLVRFSENAEAAGARVHWARDAEEACQKVVDILERHGAKLVVKGKSMVSEEIELNEVLKEKGIEVYEGDLGEFIAQQVGISPFHIVAPAVHMPVSEISRLFTQIMGIEPTEDPARLGRAARSYLREKFRQADCGITGVNVAVADTGSIVLVENEGNIRLATSKPRVHIALMSLEKVVPTLKEALQVVDVLVKSCTGQKISAYISIITGAAKPWEKDGPEELHIIIVDNGRTKIYSTPETREALRCIRCGACLGVCPVYTRIGGPAYGWVYSGPMGAVLNPLLLGLDRCRDLFEACTQCGYCQEVCPAGIKHLDMYHHYRGLSWRGSTEWRAEKGRIPFGLKLWAWAVGSPSRYIMGGRLARFFLKVKSREGRIRDLPFLKGWFAVRDLPSPSAVTFRDWWSSAHKGGR